MRGVCLIHPVLALFFYGEFLLHIPCLFDFCVGSFSYTSHAVFFFWGVFLFCFLIWGVSLTHPVLAFNLFIFYLGVSLTHPALALFFYGEFLLHIPCWLFSFFSFCFFFLSFLIWGVYFTHPVLALFSCGEFLLHIPCLLFISVGSLSYTSWVF